jgi:MYXO-CTERM domain-containing protein
LFNQLLKRLMPLAVVLSAGGLATPAFAQSQPLAASFESTATVNQTHELFYNVWRMGIALSYFGMGYADDDGNFVSLAGAQITSSRVVLTYTAAPGDDIAAIVMHMDVPVLGAQSAFFEVTGDQLVQTSPGVWQYTLTTDLFNGTVRDGRFGIESFALDGDGNPVGLGGEMSADTGFYYTVTTTPVPEPATALMLLGGLALVPALQRRRAARA